MSEPIRETQFNDAAFRAALIAALQHPDVLRALAAAVHAAHTQEAREIGERRK